MESSLNGGKSFTFALYGRGRRSILNRLTLYLEESIQVRAPVSGAGDHPVCGRSGPEILLKCPRHVALIGKTAARRHFLD